MHDSSASSQDRWLPVWLPDSSFPERYQSNYRPALAYSIAITKDFHASQETVNDAFSEFYKQMNSGCEMAPAKFKAVLRNKSIDAVRGQMRRRKIGTPESEFGSDDDGKIVPFLEKLEDKTTPRPNQAAERDDVAALIETTRAYLTEQERAIFDCKREELTDKETARRLGVTEEAVKQRWKRIKSKLRDRFGGDYVALQS